MEKFYSYSGIEIRYLIEGQGNCVVLVHGFMEGLEIWNDFARELTKEFCVIRIDLPGHGKSLPLPVDHSMEIQAEVLAGIIEREGIAEVILCGHSMGGYIALSFVEKFRNRTKALCLFHSHAAEDSTEVLKNRLRTLQLIDENKAGFIINFIPTLFAESNIPLFTSEIDALKKMASNMTTLGLKKTIKGMMQRKDQRILLQSLEIPVLYIVGKKDSKIQFQEIMHQATLPKISYVLILEHVGHLGFLEDFGRTFAEFRSFCHSV